VNLPQVPRKPWTATRSILATYAVEFDAFYAAYYKEYQHLHLGFRNSPKGVLEEIVVHMAILEVAPHDFSTNELLAIAIEARSETHEERR